MVDFLLSENGAPIRDQLSVQIVDQVDQLGVDAVAFARKNVGQVRDGVIPRAAAFVWPSQLLWESCVLTVWKVHFLRRVLWLSTVRLGPRVSHSCFPNLSLFFGLAVVQINAGKIPAFLSGDRQVLDELLSHSDMTPAMSSAVRVLNLLTSSAGFDAGKVGPCFRYCALRVLDARTPPMRVFGGMHNAVSASVVALPEDVVREHTKEALTIIRRHATTVFLAGCDPTPPDRYLVIPILL